jgi:negative regulator of sigma E activity
MVMTDSNHVEPPHSLEPSVPVELSEPFEERTRALFRDSVESVDFATRSRLTQARHAAIEAAAAARRKPWFYRLGFLTPAAGVTAAAVLGVFLWMGSPLGQHPATVTDGQPNLEDLEIVASSEEGSGDAMDMLQDDVEFYDWADKAANAGSATQG